MTDNAVAFSTTGEDMFKDEGVLSKNFDYTFFDKSIGASVGGFSNILGLGKTGLKADLSADILLGVNGGINIGSGTVDVDYMTDVNITASGKNGSDINNLVFGDHFVISASEAPDPVGIALSTEMSAFDARLNLVTDISAGVSVKAKVAGKTIMNGGLQWQLTAPNVEVVDIAADVTHGTLDFSIFGQDPISLLDQTTLFNAVERGVEFNISYLEGGVFVPELATGVPDDRFDDSAWDGKSIMNSHLPVDLSKTVTRIDYLHAGFDMAEALISFITKSASSEEGVTKKSGGPTEFDELRLNDDLALREFHVIDGILSAHFGVAQDLSFDPKLMVDLKFRDEFGAAKTVIAETFPGSKVFHAVNATRIAAGESIEIIHPGGALEIDTDYVLTGDFKNKTNLYVTPSFDLNILDGILEANLNDFDKLDLFNDGDLLFNIDFTAFSQSFPFANPIPIRNLVDRTVTFDSFDAVDGSDLSLPASPSSSFAVLAALDQLLLDEGGTVTASLVISDPHANADGNDVYEVVIDWNDGTVETLLLDPSNALPGHATYDALNRVLTLSHVYAEDTGTQPDPNHAPIAFDATLLLRATKKTLGSSNVGDSQTATVNFEVWNVPGNVTIDRLFLDNDGEATLDGSYVDQGILDSHELVVDWGDNLFSHFDLSHPGSLSPGDIVSSQSGFQLTPANLTVTSVDAVTGSVSFTVTGHKYADINSGVLVLTLVDDERYATSKSVPVPFGLDLIEFMLPASIHENGDAILSAVFVAEVANFAGLLQSFRHEVLIDWDDPNDPAPATFLLDRAHELEIGHTFMSSTDDSVLTVTQIEALSGQALVDHELSIEFEVTHRFRDDGLAAGNGTVSDISEVVLEVFDDRPTFGHGSQGATANQRINILNQAPKVPLMPFDEEVGNGGVALLNGIVIDPGSLDNLTLHVDWGDGTVDDYQLAPDPSGAQFFTLGHVYIAEGDFDVTATVTDDDGGTHTAMTPVTVDFSHPPQATDDDVLTTEDAILEIDVLADNGNGADNDLDGDLDPSLTVNLTSPDAGVLLNLGEGVFSFDPDGQFEYLAGGESQEVHFVYQIKDALANVDSGTVSILVNGTNDAPSVSPIQAVSDEDAGVFSVDLLLASGAFDVDATDVLTVSSVSLSSGRAVSFSLNGSSLEFDTNQFNDLAVGESATQVFVFSVSDDSGAANDTTSSEVAIVVHGRNDAPSLSLSSATISVDEGETASISGAIVDPDLSDRVSISASTGVIDSDDGGSGDWNWSLITRDGPEESQTVTITATDRQNVLTDTRFSLTVNNVAPSVVADVASQYVQYSDAIQSISFSATDVPLDVMNAVVSYSTDGGTTFSVGLPDAASIAGGLSFAGGVDQSATATWTVSGIADLQPGTYVVRVSVSDEDGGTGVADATIVVEPEDADVTYEGPLYLSTNPTDPDHAVAPLRAIVRDITAFAPLSDATAGHIATATVTFIVRDTGAIIASGVPVNLIGGDEKVGVAVFDWDVWLNTNATASSFDVGIIVDGFYAKDVTADDVVITVARPNGDFISGGGYIVNQSSVGTYAGETGLKTNFGFNVKYNKKRTNLQGHFTAIVRRDNGQVLKIKSNSASSLVVDPTVGVNGHATFVSKANLTDITDPLNPVGLAGNVQLIVQVTDNGEPGSGDMIGFALWDGNTLLFASHFDGAKTVEQALGGGNIQLRSDN